MLFTTDRNCALFHLIFLFSHLAPLSLFARSTCTQFLLLADRGECQCQAAVLCTPPCSVKASSGDQVLVHSCSCTIRRPRGDKISTVHTISWVQEWLMTHAHVIMTLAVYYLYGLHSCLEPVQWCIVYLFPRVKRQHLSQTIPAIAVNLHESPISKSKALISRQQILSL